MTRIDRTRWLHLRSRLNGRYGKRRTKGGHHSYDKRECWGFKIKGWWRRGDIRTTKPKKSFECWVKTAADVSKEDKKTLMEALTAPQRNAGKDEYIVDLELGTESGLIGAFGFAGACTAGDGSCDPPTRSMGAGFWNFRTL